MGGCQSQVIVQGDLNARVGSEEVLDVMRKYGGTEKECHWREVARVVL